MQNLDIDNVDSDREEDFEATDEDDDFFDSEDDEEADLPVALLIERARERRRLARCSERPGLRFNRTLSGKLHVWRRPSWQMYTVGEDVEAEKRAETEHSTYGEVSIEEELVGRGRRR
jgi:hypothetical protein